MQKHVQPARPDFIRNWREIERAKPYLHDFTKEEMVLPAPFSREFTLRRLAVRHDTVMPGWQSSPPHAERDEEEMVFILEGTPDLWSDGYLYRMKPGEAAGWAGRDGLAHCLINNTDKPVRMLTIGEVSRWNSQIDFPLASPEMKAWSEKEGRLWSDVPKRKLGPHDGRPDARRGSPTPDTARTKRKPSCVVDTKKIGEDNSHYPNDDELMSVWARLTTLFGMTRVGVGHDVLKPGRRTSWPHAEMDEEEFVYVVEGEPDVWIDGWLYRLITVGEASRQRSKCFYPLHPKRNKEIGEGLWKNPPKRKLGPHDGLSDLRRAELKKKHKRARK
jgi:uncharacterized cupin superfamily protein